MVRESRENGMSVSSEESDLSEVVIDELAPRHDKGRGIFMKEVNPETDTVTVFERDLAVSKNQNTLVRTFAAEQRVFKELQKYMRDSSKKVYSRMGKKFFPVLPLSNAKGAKPRICEVCPAKGILCCSKCTVTFYCSWAHCTADRMHFALCERIKMIRWPIPFRFSDTERRRLASQKVLIMEKLMDDLFKQSHAFIFGREYDLAMNTLLQAIKYVVPVYGRHHEFIPMIILLCSIADAQIGSKHLVSAEISINCAMMRLKKLEDINRQRAMNLTRAQIHRTQGNLFYAKKSYSQANMNFSEYIYYVTEELGPKHFRTCHGYFNLAKCFLAQGEIERALSLMDFSINNCLDYLFDLVKSIIPDPHFWTSKWDRTNVLSRYYEIEAIELLRGVLKIISVKDEAGEKEEEEEDDETEGKIIVCEAMLLFFRKYNLEARRHLSLLNQLREVEKYTKVLHVGKFIKQACITEEQHFTLS